MKPGTLIRHAIKLKTENQRIYMSFINYFEIFDTFDYVETMGFLAHGREFKEMNKSIFIFKNKVRIFVYTSCFKANPLDFTQAIAVPAEHALENYKKLINSFGLIINFNTKQIDELRKQEIINLYQSINDILDNIPESIRQVLKAQ